MTHRFPMGKYPALMRVLEQGGKFIQCIKHGCEMMGQYAGPPRPPLKGLNKDDKRQLSSSKDEAPYQFILTNKKKVDDFRERFGL